MTDKEKLEKIRSEVIWYIHLRNEGLIIGSCGDFEKLLKFIDSIQEEHKKCMYSKDNYADEDRKVLCGDCEEECEFNKKEEPVSEELEQEIINYIGFPQEIDEDISTTMIRKAARHFANWQKEKEYTCYEEAFEDGAKWKVENLWKPADGDDLPKIDREVIALLDNGKVVFAHRPPEYWDGKDIVTGKVTRNYPKTYDKGGWNIPDVKWWLDVELPKEIEL